ncbi:MAG: integrase domain-containing protein [Gammaproteobacteria bacterium]|nr:integrase domain-containing protein [Gammaproteobacteria bacterium]
MTWKHTLNDVLKRNNRTAAVGGKAVGQLTRMRRAEVLEGGFKQLRKLGYGIQDVRHLKQKHVVALVKYWEKTEYAPKTIQNYVSIFRTFSNWINKPNMVPATKYLVSNPETFSVAKKAESDKGWRCRLDTRGKIEKIANEDERVAIQIELQAAFGLRARESWCIRPHLSDKHHYLDVSRGTKGGRQRIVAIDNEYKRSVLERAKEFCPNPTDSMIPRERTLVSWKDYYYRILRNNEIGRLFGITGHGLRHDYANDLFETISGIPSPVRGGPKLNRTIEKNVQARLEVAQDLGHCREDISTAYCG